jgi:hypothetical protein
MRRGHGVPGGLAAACLLAAALAGAAEKPAGPAAPAPPAPTPAPIAYGEGKEIARLASPEVTESSGLAPSRIRPGLFWTHNDAGNPAVLYAFSDKGEDLGAYPVQAASSTDWEDLASFTLGGKPYLLIADVGDNLVQRKSYTLYLVAEPPVAAKPPALPLAARVDFTYEDGPHNCESMGVDPVRQEVLLVSKTSGAECKAYALPLPREKAVRGAVARALATLRIPTTTAMDVSPDGRRAIILTYGDAYEYTRDPKEDWAAAFARPPRTLRMPPRPQGESIAYGPDGRTLYLTSEGAPAPLLRVSPAAPAGPAPPAARTLPSPGGERGRG